MPFRQQVRQLVNPLLSRVAGARLVNDRWGPRGFAASFEKLRRRGFLPRCVVDVGAATGTWTRECAAVFPTAHYWMIDPLEENRAALGRVRTDARVDAQYTIAALGAAHGELVLHVHGDQSSAFASEYDARGTTRTLQVATMDELLEREQVPPPDLIKVDVQGYELEVLRGAQKAMRTAEFVLLEVSFRQAYKGCPLAHEVFSCMAAWGYRIHDICTYSQRPRDGELFQSDVLFARVESSVFAFEGYA